MNPNSCSLHDAVQQLSNDDQADIPFIVWLVENSHSPIALPRTHLLNRLALRNRSQLAIYANSISASAALKESPQC